MAYQVVGDGPFDLVFVPGWTSNVDVMWEEPSLARFLHTLAAFSRLERPSFRRAVIDWHPEVRVG